MDQAGLGKVSPVSYLLVACIVQSFFFFSFPPGQKARIYISWAESVRGACQHEKKKKSIFMEKAKTEFISWTFRDLLI